MSRRYIFLTNNCPTEPPPSTHRENLLCVHRRIWPRWLHRFAGLSRKPIRTCRFPRFGQCETSLISRRPPDRHSCIWSEHLPDFHCFLPALESTACFHSS